MRLVRHPHLLSFATIALLLCAVEWWIARSVGFAANADLLALAITVDLTVGLPLCYYLLVVHPRRAPAISLIPVFIVALVLASAILPPAQQMYLDRIAYVLPLIEGGALLFALYNIRRVVQQYRRVRPTMVYPTDALEASLGQVFGKSPVLTLLVTELSIPYYVLFGWLQRFTTSDPSLTLLSHHRASRYGALVGMFGGALLLETIGLHLVIQHWSDTAAWVLTALSIYSLIWLIGDYQAVRLHPHVLSDQQLLIRTGLRWRIDVDWHNIAAVQRTPPHRSRRVDYVNAAVEGEPKLVLQLHEPVTARGLFGIQRRVRQIGLTVDDEATLRAALRERAQI